MVDALSTVKTLLETDWTDSNTDSITPIVEIIMNAKTINAVNNDYILLYELDESIDPFGIGAQEWAHKRVVSIDIRTTFKRAAIPDIRPHLIKLKDEVFRIMKINVDNPDADHQLVHLRRRRDLSDKSIGIGRMVIDVELKYWGT